MKYVFLKILFILILSFIGIGTPLAQDTLPNLQIEKIEDTHFIDVIDLAKKLKLGVSWKSESGILQINSSTESSNFVLNNKWVSTKDTSFLLPKSVRNVINSKTSFWVPISLPSIGVFEKLLNRSFTFDSSFTKVIMGLPKEVKDIKDIYSVNFDTKNNGEILEIKLSKAFIAEQFYAHPNYILRINKAVIDSSMFLALLKKSSMISRIIPIQEKQSAQLTLTLKENCENVELIKKDGGKTLQIVLRKKVAAQKQPEKQVNKNSVKIKTIIIDPGHGGKDPGAIGYKNLKEKDIVLAVALKLKKKLESKGFTVKLTRNKDEFVELAKRPKTASDNGGDLFISLHCDAVPGKDRQLKTEGFKFYILRAGGSEEDKAIARRENQAIALESAQKNKTEISPAEWIVLDNQLALYAERSALLAGNLVENFEGGAIKKMQTGAGQAGFMVLVGAYMPAVLAELGFITHPKDAQNLSSEKGQNDIAERLTKSIVNFSKN